MENIKDDIPFSVTMFENEFKSTISNIKSPKELLIKSVSHGYANKFVLQHHSLKRKIYIAKNVSYGLFAGSFCIGVCMFGYPVWREYPGIVPPLLPAQCPELIRLCTVSGIPKNSESFFVGACLRLMLSDWTKITGVKPDCVTSLCDHSMGFDGAIYKATNFSFFRKTIGRPANPGKAHGKWGKNTSVMKSEKSMYVYFYDRKRHD